LTIVKRATDMVLNNAIRLEGGDLKVLYSVEGEGVCDVCGAENMDMHFLDAHDLVLVPCTHCEIFSVYKIKRNNKQNADE